MQSCTSSCKCVSCQNPCRAVESAETKPQTTNRPLSPSSIFSGICAGAASTRRTRKRRAGACFSETSRSNKPGNVGRFDRAFRFGVWLMKLKSRGILFYKGFRAARDSQKRLLGQALLCLVFGKCQRGPGSRIRKGKMQENYRKIRPGDIFF